MSSITIEYLGYIAPEYAGIDPERFNALQEIANEFVNERAFGNKTKYATALYIAHMLKVGEQQGSGSGSGSNGKIISEKVGDISRTYSDNSTTFKVSSGGLEETNYGRQYLTVRRSILKTPMI